MTSKARIFVAGHQGMVGSALVKELEKNDQVTIITRARKDLDLCDQSAVNAFFESTSVDQVYVSAAKVGGIRANTVFPAEFIFENLMIQTNIINGAFRAGVKKILFLGSSCIYPRHAAQPILEDALLTGKLEPTNEPYAIAKIAGIKLCESYNQQYGLSHGIDYRSVMPTNVYGPRDKYDPENAHVIPALIYKFDEAKKNKKSSVTVWGSGTPRREFLYSQDLASACVFVMNLEKAIFQENREPFCSHINVGSQIELTIKALAEKIKQVVGFEGVINFDVSKPDGVSRKLICSNRLTNLGWGPRVDFSEGLSRTYLDFKRRQVDGYLSKNPRV
jgi:GDP-L-fucose synthase